MSYPKKIDECFNCHRFGHKSHACEELRCGKSHQHFEFLYSPGRHTSCNCPMSRKRTRDRSIITCLEEISTEELLKTIQLRSNTLHNSGKK